jgi:hypothetical protein
MMKLIIQKYTGQNPLSTHPTISLKGHTVEKWSIQED